MEMPRARGPDGGIAGPRGDRGRRQVKPRSRCRFGKARATVTKNAGGNFACAV